MCSSITRCIVFDLDPCVSPRLLLSWPGTQPTDKRQERLNPIRNKPSGCITVFSRPEGWCCSAQPSFTVSLLLLQLRAASAGPCT